MKLLELSYEEERALAHRPMFVSHAPACASCGKKLVARASRAKEKAYCSRACIAGEFPGNYGGAPEPSKAPTFQRLMKAAEKYAKKRAWRAPRADIVSRSS